MEMFEWRERIQDVNNNKEATALLSEIDPIVKKLEEEFSMATLNRDEANSMKLAIKMKYYFKMKDDLQQIIH